MTTEGKTETLVPNREDALQVFVEMREREVLRAEIVFESGDVDEWDDGFYVSRVTLMYVDGRRDSFGAPGRSLDDMPLDFSVFTSELWRDVAGRLIVDAGSRTVEGEVAVPVIEWRKCKFDLDEKDATPLW